jgi:hypothetical protein
VRWIVCVVVATALLVGCDGDDASNLSEQDAAAICAAQVRFNGKIYHGWDVTKEPADAKAGMAERPVCDDVGRHAKGNHYPSDPDQVDAWKFEGYPTSEVIGIQRPYGLELYVADDVPDRRREAIVADLGAKGT